MKYPVQKTDLKDNIASDDEQATMIVVEAIVSNSFDGLKFSDENRRETLRELVEDWEKFDEFSKVISSQKSLLNRAIGSASERVDSEDLPLSNSIAATAFESAKREIKKDKRTKMMGGLSVAAGLIIFAIGISSVLSSQNSGTKSSSIKRASVQTTSSPEEEKVSSTDSFTAQDNLQGETKSNSGAIAPLSANPENGDSVGDRTVRSGGGSTSDSIASADSQKSSSAAQSYWSLSRIIIFSSVGIALSAILIFGLLFLRKRPSS